MVFRRSVLLVASAATLLATACAPRQVVQREPPPCTDPLYLRLKVESPDSLSEREWIRLQDLERACVTARTAAQHGGESGMMVGMGRNTWWAMSAIMVVGAAMWLMMGVGR